MLLGFTTLFITDFPAKIVQFPSHFQMKRSSYNEVECVNTDLYGENTTFILYFDIKNSRDELYDLLGHNKNPQ